MTDSHGCHQEGNPATQKFALVTPQLLGQPADSNLHGKCWID